MLGFTIFIHAAVCILLVVIILMQSGRGGGLTAGAASAESMFGAQTNAFMIKATTIFCIFFFVTCLCLAFLSSKKDKSLMSNKVAVEKVNEAVDDVVNAAEDALDVAQDAVVPMEAFPAAE